MTHARMFRSIAWSVVLLIAPVAALAQPGLNNEPWSAQAYDQSTMAIAMAQMNGQDPSSSTPSQTLVCGGGTGTSSATANSTCIILNNSTGSTVGTGQTSDGSQTATSTTQTKTVTNTMSGALSGLVPGGGN